MHNALMARLARRSLFSNKFGVRYVDGRWPHLEIDNPIGVVRLIGEAKQQVANGRVFLRGQLQQYDTMLPSLFRGNLADRRTLMEAQTALTERLQREILVKRFQYPEVPSLLQHYGLRTSYLDVVDNLFVAVWFATNELQTTEDSFVDTNSSLHEYGWLYLVASTAGSEQLRVVDLRTEHHALSSRPHVQHGISLATVSSAEHDFRDFVVATVRFPKSTFTTRGTLFESSFLFPSPEVDHTLRLLLDQPPRKQD